MVDSKSFRVKISPSPELTFLLSKRSVLLCCQTHRLEIGRAFLVVNKNISLVRKLPGAQPTRSIWKTGSTVRICTLCSLELVANRPLVDGSLWFYAPNKGAPVVFAFLFGVSMIWHGYQC
jgi:hypothetical protein